MSPHEYIEIDEAHVPSEVFYDLDDHLTLIVGPQKVRYQVSRHVLLLSSKVFRAMLTDGMREISASEIPLPEDEPAALRLVLLTAHMKFEVLPSSISLEMLAALAELCDKYGICTLVRRQFLEDNNIMKMATYSRPGLYHAHIWQSWRPRPKIESAWVAWTFGYVDLYEAILAYAVWRVDVVDGDVQGLRCDGCVIPALPYGMLATIEGKRQTIIQALITKTYIALQRLLTPRRYADLSKSASDFLELGRLALFMYEVHWPVDLDEKVDASQVLLSIREIETALWSVDQAPKGSRWDAVVGLRKFLRARKRGAGEPTVGQVEYMKGQERL